MIVKPAPNYPSFHELRRLARQVNSIRRWGAHAQLDHPADVARRNGREEARIAVGMPITGHPPHRSGRAQFGHPAPTLGV